jgi:DNA repair protein RadD
MGLYPNGPTFDSKIWHPWKAMKDELTRQGILSQPIHESLPTERTFHFDVDLSENVAGENISKFRKRNLEDIASDFERNKKIVTLLLELSKNWKSILYFAPSVNNANIISAILREKGIASAVVTAGTNRGIRQKYIRKFREQTIKVLCNYGVLTTGFDAPLIDAIVIGRPTESRNLYEQMIGRGLRGPVFGGTEKCLIMDLVDNITIYSSEGPERFLDKSIEFWENVDMDDEFSEESLE